MTNDTSALVPLLRKELKQAGIDLRAALPKWARKKTVSETILNELAVTLLPPIHEGVVPPYGSLIHGGDAGLKVITIPKEDLEVARKAADGSTALLVHGPNGFEGLTMMRATGTPELYCAELALLADSVIIRRDRAGATRLYSEYGSLRHAHRHWSVSPSLEKAIEQTLLHAPMISRQQFHAILAFAYYVLSVWHIGSTLIWLLTDDDPFPEALDLRNLEASVGSGSEAPSPAFVAHLLQQYDGATVVAKDGRILRTGVHLVPSDRARELIPASAGTRHTSARRSSFDRPTAIFVTVSADGPVSIFSDGMNVFSLDWYSAADEAHRMRDVVNLGGYSQSFVDRYPQRCETCGKTSSIEIHTITGQRGHEEARCPICHTIIAEDMCWRIHANLLKVL